MSAVAVGDVIQITDTPHPWFPCLLIVEEVKPWGVLAFVLMPLANDGSKPPGGAYNRLETGSFEVIGQAKVTHAA